MSVDNKHLQVIRELAAKYRSLAIFILAFGVVGLFTLFASHAAGPTVSLEAEQGSISGPAAVCGIDTTAAKGNCVQFKKSSASSLPTAGDTAGGSTGWRHAIASLTPAGSGPNPVAGFDTPGACGTTGSLLTVSGGVYTVKGSSAGTIIDGCQFGSPGVPGVGRQVVVNSGGAVTLKNSAVYGNDGNSDAGGAAVRWLSGSTGTMSDFEIAQTDPTVANDDNRQDRSIDASTKGSGQLTINRLYSHDTARGLNFPGASNITINDSYMMNQNRNVNQNPDGTWPSDCGIERNHASSMRATSGANHITLNNNVQIILACSWSSGLNAFYPECTGAHDVTINGGLWQLDSGGQNSGYGMQVGSTPVHNPDSSTCLSGESPDYNFVVKNVQICISKTYHFGNDVGCFSDSPANGWFYASGSTTTAPLGGCVPGSSNCPAVGSPQCNNMACIITPTTNIWQDNVVFDPGGANNGKCVGPNGAVGGTPGSGTGNCYVTIIR